MDGQGHPLPASDEARHDEIPEHDQRDKGLGDDDREAIQPADPAATPAGEAYPTGKNGDEIETDRG